MKLSNDEASVVREVLKTLERWGFPPLRINSGLLKHGDHIVRLAPAGTSDVLSMVPGSGRLFAIECKRPVGGKLTTKQTEFLDLVDELGGVAIVVNDIRILDRAISLLRINPFAKIHRNGERL